MALPGLLIEYLVAGALALPWLLTFIPVDLERLTPAQLPFLIVALYVVGMGVDVIAFGVTRPLKWRLRGHAARKLGLEHRANPGSAAARLVRLMKYSPEVAKEVAARSSRDRIARGTVINAALTCALQPSVQRWVSGAVCLGALGMWMFFEMNSYTFEIRAEEAIERAEQRSLGV